MKKETKHGEKKAILIGFLLGALALIIASGPLKAYQITKGDTLWDVSEKFLKNPFLWPKVWALNPYISNPHWIYPGNRLKLKPSHPSPSAAAPTAARTTKPTSIVSLQPKPTSPKPRPPILTHENIHAEGFIAESKLHEVGRILTNEDGTPLNSEPNVLCFYTREGEIVYPGDRFTTFTYVKTVHHPETGEKMGYLVALGGEVEVFRVEGRVCFAEILHSYKEIEEGDPVGRFAKWPSKLVITPFRKPLQGRIVMMKDGLMMGAQDKVVYIDKGSSDGLRPGNKLTIYKDCPKRNDPYQTSPYRCKAKIAMPDRKIGTLVVLSTQPHTATALVYENEREIEVGDKIRP